VVIGKGRGRFLVRDGLARDIRPHAHIVERQDAAPGRGRIEAPVSARAAEPVSDLQTKENRPKPDTTIAAASHRWSATASSRGGLCGGGINACPLRAGGSFAEHASERPA